MNQCFLRSLKLKNYRCFGDIDLSFHPRLTVFVGLNGGGKTAVLDGVAVALRLFVDTIEGRANSKGFEARDIRLVLNPDNKMEPVTPVRLEASADLLGNDVSWARERQSADSSSRTKTGEAGDLKRVAARLAEANQDWAQSKVSDVALFPLVSYYGTGRLWSMSKLTERKKMQEFALNMRLRGYTDCLSSSSHYKFFIDWFRRYSYEGQKNAALSPHRVHSMLAVVRDAVDIALEPSGWRAIEWDFVEDTIVAEHPGFGRLPVDSLSDGIRNMIGLVADIAHRAVRLNPQLGQRAASETPGIVLIDEVDMHLHPQWQQVVLGALERAFPLIQFVVTTHSPQVLTTVRKENIRVFSRGDDGIWSATAPAISPFAHESGDALAHILDTHPRPALEDVLPDIHAYEQLARAGKSDSPEARDIKQRLDQRGFEFNEAERSLFAFLAHRAAENGKQ